MKETAEDIIRLSASRDSRCALALRVNSLTELGHRFTPDPTAHFLVTLIGDCAKCKICVNSSLCRCLRDHFQSTTNSKRRVSTYLFWKNKLGLAFPVSDEMLERNVWMNLESCDHGIKRGNGQRKQKKGPICANPYHYYPADAYAVLTPLSTTLGILGLTADKVIHQTLTHMGWNGAVFQPPPGTEESLGLKGFELICARLRQMSEEAVSAVDNPYDSPVNSPQTTIQQVQQHAQAPQIQPPMHNGAGHIHTPESSPQYSSEFTGAMPAEYLVPHGQQYQQHQQQQQAAQAAAAAATTATEYDLDFDFGIDDGAVMNTTAANMLDDVHNAQFSQQQLDDLAALEQHLMQQEKLGAGQLPPVMGLSQEELAQLLTMPDPAMQGWGTANFNTAQPGAGGVMNNMSSFEFQWNGNPEPVFQSSAVDEVDPATKLYDIGDECVTGNVVVMQHTKHTVKVENLAAGNVGTAGHVGILRHEKGAKKHVCVMGVIDVRVLGPAKGGDTLYADLEGNAGRATTTAPAGRRVVIGKVLAAAVEAIEAGPDAENLVSSVVSLTAAAADHDGAGAGAGGAGARAALVRAARLRAQLRGKKGGAAAAAPAAGEPEPELDGKMQSLAVEEKRAIRFQKVASGVSAEDAVVLFSHRTSKALRVRVDGAVDAAGPLDAAALFVVVPAKGGMVRLQSALDDDLWLNAEAGKAVDGKGDPDEDEGGTLFRVEEHADGRVSLLGRAGSALVVGEDGAVSASASATQRDGACPDEAALFTAYRRIMLG